MNRMSEKSSRKIIHSDCDCFYAAIESRDDPKLLGRPIAVGGRPDQRGVVASCNYEARAFGVRSAMPMAQALRRCPDLCIIRPAMEKYRIVSHRILAIYRIFTPLVEPLSLDEAFLDVSHSEHFQGSATRIAEDIKRRVRSEVGITVSLGVAPNKFLAKVASAWQKPDGLYVITPDAVDDFVARLPVEKLFGVGAVTAGKLRAHGLASCADIQKRSRFELRTLCGVFGDRLFDLAHGIDRREVTPDQERKSLSVEETYVRDLVDLPSCQMELAELVARLQEVAKKLRPHEAIDRIFVKIRFDDFRKTTIERGAKELDAGRFQELLAEGFNRITRPVRLLGVGARIAPRSTAVQIPLFDAGEPASQSDQGSPT